MCVYIYIYTHLMFCLRDSNFCRGRAPNVCQEAAVLDQTGKGEQRAVPKLYYTVVYYICTRLDYAIYYNLLP